MSAVQILKFFHFGDILLNGAHRSALCVVSVTLFTVWSCREWQWWTRASEWYTTHLSSHRTRSSTITPGNELIKEKAPGARWRGTLCRFSGISEEDVKANHMSLVDVQKTLLSFISADTILIGHGLETDFCALKVTLWQCYFFFFYGRAFNCPACNYMLLP